MRCFLLASCVALFTGVTFLPTIITVTRAPTTRTQEEIDVSKGSSSLWQVPPKPPAHQQVQEEVYAFENHNQPISPNADVQERQSLRLLRQQQQNSRGIKIPYFRYVVWDDLDSETRTNAQILGYTSSTWNKPGTASVEQLTYQSVVSKQSDWSNAMESLGFNQEQWDCYINHYFSYDWYELANKHVQEYFVAMGWHQSIWFGSPPSAFAMSWSDLTSIQRNTVVELCYFQATWDGDSMDIWRLDRIPINSRGIRLPKFRFVAWSNLSQSTQKQAQTIGYNSTSWNNPGSFGKELFSYDTMTGNSARIKAAIDSIGFAADQWDCFVSHYFDNLWDDLDNLGVQGYFMTLGWSSSTWASDSYLPSIYTSRWTDLTDNQRNAAVQICFFQEIWDQKGLDLWILPGQAAPTADQSSTNQSSSPSPKPASTQPSRAPVEQLSPRPTQIPTLVPTERPTTLPTTSWPTLVPTRRQSSSPTSYPTFQPTVTPTDAPVKLTWLPTAKPTDETAEPMVIAIQASLHPTQQPSSQPSQVSTLSTVPIPSYPLTPKPVFSLKNDSLSPTVIQKGISTSNQPTISRFVYFSLEPLNPTLAPTRLETSSFPSLTPSTTSLPPYPPVAFPHFRYIPWLDLNRTTRGYAELLSYNESTWDNPGSALVESLSFELLEDIAKGQATVQLIGFTSVQWDCYVNHFKAYTWDMIMKRSMVVYLEALGWTKDSWIGLEDKPMAVRLRWEELSSRQQQAATDLCYFRETWDNLPLNEWYQYSTDSTHFRANEASPMGAPPVSTRTVNPVGSYAVMNPSSSSIARSTECWLFTIALTVGLWFL